MRVRLFALVLVVSCACGTERSPWSPWNAFPLFPDAGAMRLDSGAEAPPQVLPGGSGSPAMPPMAAAGVGASGLGGGGGGGAAGPPLMAAGASGSPTMMPVTPPQPITTAFRVTELYLRDPHVFIGLSDVTDQPLAGVSVNGSAIPNKLNKDADGDGYLDVSLVLLVRPFDASSTEATLTLVNAQCPIDTTKPCTPIAGSAAPAAWPIDYHASGDCLEPVAGTTSAYQPPVGIPNAPCLHSGSTAELALDVGGIDIQVVTPQLGATYQTQPTAALSQGLLSGFVTNSAAMNAIIPMDVGAPVAGHPLSNYIAQRDHDLASSPNMQDGFWIYLNFVAKPISYQP